MENNKNNKRDRHRITDSVASFMETFLDIFDDALEERCSPLEKRIKILESRLNSASEKSDTDSISSRGSNKVVYNKEQKEKIMRFLEDYAIKKEMNNRNVKYKTEDGKQIDTMFYDLIVDMMVNGIRIKGNLSKSLNTFEKEFIKNFRQFLYKKKLVVEESDED